MVSMKINRWINEENLTRVGTTFRCGQYLLTKSKRETE